MSGYTKLFGSILASTVWELPLATKVVWITMLAMSDRNGEVQASVPGLAKFAGVSLEQCEEALAAFMSPDRYSRTKENDGRRIEEISGGWRLLNHGKYREQLSADLQRERDTERKRRLRAGQKRDKAGHFGTVPASPDIAEAAPAPAPEAEAEAEAREKEIVTAPSARDGAGVYSACFLQFWNGYPRKVGKGDAWKAWKRIRPPIGPVLLALGVQKGTPDWRKDNGAFIPHPATWLNGRRWEDEPNARMAPSRSQGPPVAIAEAMGQRAQELAAQSELKRLAAAEQFKRERQRDTGGTT